MSRRTLSIIPLLALLLLGGCGPQKKAPARDSKDMYNEMEGAPDANSGIDPALQDIGSIFRVRDEAFLAKKDTDIYLLNRERRDGDAYDGRLERGLIIPLPAGTELSRRRERRSKRHDKSGRLYVPCVVLTGEAKGEQGLVALDELQKVK